MERQVEARQARQRRLSGPHPLELWAVLEESVLRRPVGGAAVLEAQLDHLLEMSEQANVTIQVLPTDAGGHAGLSGSFLMLEFPDPEDLDVVYVDVAGGELYLSSPDEVRSYRLTFTKLCAVALPPTESRDLIVAARRRT